MDDAAALYSARVQYGIAKGHQFMGNFSALVTDPSPDSLQRLVLWKDARVSDEFSRKPEQDEDGEREEGCADGEGGEEEMERSDVAVGAGEAGAGGGELEVQEKIEEQKEEQKDGENLMSSTVGT